MLIELRADPDIQRWLDFVAPRERERLVKGVRYYRAHDGVWVEKRPAPEVATTRTPDLVVDADAYAKVVAAQAPQGDVNDALRGLEGVEVENVDGTKRIDYPAIPLKTADGKLTRYAKNLIDMHAPAARVGAEVAQEIQQAIPREPVERLDGCPVEVPRSLAEPMLRTGKLKERRRRKVRR